MAALSLARLGAVVPFQPRGWRMVDVIRQEDFPRLPRILLLEDDEQVRVLMEHVLKSGGYDVDPVATVAGARALLRDRDYDLLLADGILPDGTGFMVAEDAERRGIQAILVTAYAERFAKEDLARFGLLIKPVRPDELLSAVDGALGR